MRRAADIDELADDEVVGGELGADRDQRVIADAELDDLALGLDLGDGEMAALSLRDVLDLGQARPELHGDIAVLLDRAMSDDLAVIELQHGDRDMFAGIGEDAGHPDFLCNHTGTHRCIPSLGVCTIRPKRWRQRTRLKIRA